jgi:UDP-N-acetylglucosamine acyltransferase
MIHPTAIVGRDAVVASDCEIGPFSIVEDGVVLSAGCRLGPHVIVCKGSLIGEKVSIHAGAVVGGDPQDLTFNPDIASGVSVGAHTVIREGVTVNRSTQPGGMTRIGSHCFLMATSHIAHDCQLGDRVILANAGLLAGHVAVGDHTFIGGGAAVHQFCRVGEGVMLGGGAAISLDIPPFTMVAERNRLVGFNLVGLKRRGVDRETVRDLKRCFAAVYRKGGNPRQTAAAALETGLSSTPEAERFLRFFTEGKRGIARPGTADGSSATSS